jgi:hypothetical protein
LFDGVAVPLAEFFFCGSPSSSCLEARLPVMAAWAIFFGFGTLSLSLYDDDNDGGILCRLFRLVVISKLALGDAFGLFLASAFVVLRWAAGGTITAAFSSN